VTGPTGVFNTSQAYTFTSTITFATLLETATINASAPTSTTNFDAKTQSVVYYTSNNTANFTLNIRGDGSTSVNTMMSTGNSMSLTLLVTNGSTAYYPNVIQIDGNTVTTKWVNGTTVSGGNASGIDVYSFTIIKTASATYTVLGSQTKFA
jgi:hypothetical protein